MTKYRETTSFIDRSFTAQDIIRFFTNNIDQSEQWQVGQFILKFYEVLGEEPPPLPESIVRLLEDTYKWLDDASSLFDLLSLTTVMVKLPLVIKEGFNLIERWYKVITEYQTYFE